MNHHSIERLISAIKGLLESLGRSANFVNAGCLLKDRGTKLVESKTDGTDGYSNTIVLRLHNGAEETSIKGTIYGESDRRIVQINDYKIYVPSEGNLVIAIHEDKPNIIGPCCMALGADRINIGGMHVGRISEGMPQLMVLNVDQPVSEVTMDKVRSVPGIITAKSIVL